MGLFGGNASISGYSCEQVNALRDAINNTAKKAGDDIVERLHTDIIAPMSKVWYAPEAVTFFEGFASTVKASGTNITAAFDAFRTAVQEAGQNWAENTGGEKPMLAAIDEVHLNLNVSDIQPDNGGVVSIEENTATSIANNLSQVEQGIESDLKNLAQSLNADTAFLGHGQADALEKCFVLVSGEIHKVFKYLTDGDESLKGQIAKAVQKYADVSSGITDAFNNTSFE